MKTILEEWLEDPEFRRMYEIVGQQMDFEDRLFAWLQKNNKGTGTMGGLCMCRRSPSDMDDKCIIDWRG